MLLPLHSIQLVAFANNIDDIALVQEVISGFDSMDSTSENIEVPAYTKFSK